MVDFSPDDLARFSQTAKELLPQADRAQSQSDEAAQKSADFSKRMLAESWRLLRERGWERLK
jgi:hypothetical protein